MGGDPQAATRAGRLGRRGALALLAVAALGLALPAGDRWLRQREFSQLLAHTAAGRAAAGYASARVAASISYTSPLITSNAATPEQRRSLEQIVQDAAGGQVGAVRVERQRTAAVHVLPWHASQRAARTRCAGYLAGRVDYLSSVAADFDALYRSQPQARDELAAARAALRAAAPDASHRTQVDGALP